MAAAPRTKGDAALKKPVDATALLPKNRHFFRYEGSLYYFAMLGSGQLVCLFHAHHGRGERHRDFQGDFPDERPAAAADTPAHVADGLARRCSANPRDRGRTHKLDIVRRFMPSVIALGVA